MSELMTLFLVAVLGYLLGRITIKGLCLGTSGVLIVALVFGHFGFTIPTIIQNFGLACFVTAVGFIAGPTFFRNFKRHAVSYILMGVLVILVGAAVCIMIIEWIGIPIDLSVGMMSGALTSTPGLAAAIESTGSDMASVGYGIAYPFGVIGVVLFVQLLPRILNVDIDAEKEKLESSMKHKEENPEKLKKWKMIDFDVFGFCVFFAAVVCGILIGKITIPLPAGASFSLGTSGGPLLAGLLFGHFAHIGPVNISVPKGTLNLMRELGMCTFLIGTGTTAGQGFIATLREYGVELFVFGVIMTLVPLFIGYLLARYVFKLNILSALGSLCGGMTSTPSLGVLMKVTDSEAVALSYASTYPVALIMVVLCCQFIPIICGM